MEIFVYLVIFLTLIIFVRSAFNGKIVLGVSVVFLMILTAFWSGTGLLHAMIFVTNYFEIPHSWWFLGLKVSLAVILEELCKLIAIRTMGVKRLWQGFIIGFSFGFAETALAVGRLIDDGFLMIFLYFIGRQLSSGMLHGMTATVIAAGHLRGKGMFSWFFLAAVVIHSVFNLFALTVIRPSVAS